MFYSNFLKLCNQRNIKPTVAAIEMGFQKSVVSRWKKSTPTNANRLKIADYFGITVDELMGDNEKENAPAPERDERKAIIDEIMNYVEKLSPEYQKIALAQLKALSQAEEK